MKRWSGRSGLAKVDLYTRGTMHALVWLGAAGLPLVLLALPPGEDGNPVVSTVAFTLSVTEGVLCGRLAGRAMDAYLGRGQVPPRLLWSAGAVTAATTLSVLLLGAMTHPHEALVTMLAAALMPFLTVHCLLVRNRTTVLVQAAVLAAVSALIVLTAETGVDVVFTMVTVAFATGWMAFTARASMWVLAVMWELREARDVQARLAVAEERLRFGRDLHDVLGRNLAVIALKSELAVQLARRERPEAVDQMTEVQRIARESQREVRDVVRGYREADLRVELEGARGVLAAAGITCTVLAGDTELPGEVQSALAWVVREATTNVLRHGDARRCTISVRGEDGGVVLVVENDGAEGAGADAGADAGAGADAVLGAVPGTGTGAEGQGSGLAGLRERLSAVDGTLEAGRARGGRFRLTARVPVKERGPDGSRAGASPPEASRVDGSRAGASQPDRSQPDRSPSSGPPADGSQPDRSRPDGSQPEASQPDRSRADGLDDEGAGDGVKEAV